MAINGFDNEELINILIGSIKNSKLIKNLDFQNKGYYFKIFSEETLEKFSDIVNYIEDLNLSDCGIDDKAFKIICNGIRTSKSIKNIDFFHNQKITDLTPLALALTENTSIKNLNLQGFYNVEEGIDEFLSAIELNSELIFDNLNLDGFNSEYSPKLLNLIKYDKARNLYFNECFTEVEDLNRDVQYEEILNKISEFLPKAKRLLKLYLNNNDLINSEEFCQTLVKSIKGNSIIYIDTSKSIETDILKKPFINRRNIEKILNKLVDKFMIHQGDLTQFPYYMLTALEERYSSLQYLFNEKLFKNQDLKIVVETLYPDYSNDNAKGFSRLINNLQQHVSDNWNEKAGITTQNSTRTNFLLDFTQELKSKIGFFINGKIVQKDRTWQEVVTATSEKSMEIS
ncbi:MAG: hypothetical protein ACK4OM_07010 [Alphaproteobacteria bacterium]